MLALILALQASVKADAGPPVVGPPPAVKPDATLDVSTTTATLPGGVPPKKSVNAFGLVHAPAGYISWQVNLQLHKLVGGNWVAVEFRTVDGVNPGVGPFGHNYYEKFDVPTPPIAGPPVTYRVTMDATIVGGPGVNNAIIAPKTKTIQVNP
ncbi:MAG: hypothetical protein ACRCZF_27060 [Gemmataceae bacterium]